MLDYNRQKEGGERMNKSLMAIIVLIVVLGTFIFLGNKTTSTSIQQPKSISENSASTEIDQQGKVVNVALADNGFTPKDITVKTGTRVVWTNSSGKAGTVSSNDHPTHRLYPFLNLGEFSDDSSVQVVFEKQGNYTYHNHLNASQKGTVTVE